jgi:hypothetical protein
VKGCCVCALWASDELQSEVKSCMAASAKFIHSTDLQREGVNLDKFQERERERERNHSKKKKKKGKKSAISPPLAVAAFFFFFFSSVFFRGSFRKLQNSFAHERREVFKSKKASFEEKANQMEAGFFGWEEMVVFFFRPF